MHRRLGVVTASLVLLGTAGTGRATDVPIVGTKLIAMSKAGRAKVSFVAKDAAITKGTGIVEDGSLAATLEITYDGVSGGFTMPAPSWRNSSVLAKYTNNDAPTGGSIKKSLIKPGLMLRASAQSLGEVPLDISSAPTGAVYVADTIVNGTETNRLCTQFAGCVHKPIAAGTGYKLVCRGNSTGDAACTAAGSAITDECAFDTDNCDDNATCTDTLASFTCTCNAGYTGDGVTCTDDDECTLGTDNCDANAACTNTPGSFSCGCNTGYSGDGVTCTDDDECALGADNCDANATCTNTPGSFSCACDAGYSGDGVTCTDDDECALGADNCDANATCTNTPGSFSCACNAGYSGDGVTCTSADTSCRALLDANPGLPSGTYTIDPDGNGGLPPRTVYCDMVFSGGGWTNLDFT